MTTLRNRIIDRRKVLGRDLIPNPKNWRIHDRRQKEALDAILKECGIVDDLLVRDAPEGLILIDGHCRAAEYPDQVWDVAVTDLTEEEADLLLATLDPLSALAQTDAAAYRRLLDTVANPGPAVAELLALVRGDDAPPDVRALNTIPAPSTTWVLIGIPTVDYGAIASDIGRIAMRPRVVCEVCSNGADTQD